MARYWAALCARSGGTMAAMGGKAKMARRWVFTSWIAPTVSADAVTWAVWQEEVAPGTGRHHWQGAIVLPRTARISAVKKIIGDPTAHLEVMAGTAKQAGDYCHKAETGVPGTQVEIGTRPGEELARPGRRSDLEAAASAIESGDSLLWIAHTMPGVFLKYSRGLLALQTLHNAQAGKKWRPLQVTVWWGDAGCGKTRRAYAEFPDLYCLNRSTGGTVWWDGYDGQKTLLLDEFDGTAMPLRLLLQVLDGYPLRLDTKGGHAWANWERVVLTSNTEPTTWYGPRPELARRIHAVERMCCVPEVGGNTGPENPADPPPPVVENQYWEDLVL